jgi:hypothetical protein
MKEFAMTMLACLAGLAVAGAIPGGAEERPDAKTISRGERFELSRARVKEMTTLVLFIQETSTMENELIAELQKAGSANTKLAVRIVRLSSTDDPAAKQHEVAATPFAIVLDRFGKELARTGSPDEIRAAVRKGSLMARLPWIDEDDPKAKEFYRAPEPALKRGIPGIVKTYSLRPEVFQIFNLMSSVHFSDGFLKRREHEIVASYVSALNDCMF